MPSIRTGLYPMVRTQRSLLLPYTLVFAINHALYAISMPVVSKIPASSTKKKADEGLSSNSRPAAVPALPRYLLPTNSSLFRSGQAPNAAATRDRTRAIVAPPSVQKATPIAFGTTIRTERKKVVSPTSPPSLTPGSAANPGRLPSTHAARPSITAAPATTKATRPVTAAPIVRDNPPIPAKVRSPPALARTTPRVATNRSLPPVSAPVARPATSPRGGNQFQTVKDMFTSTLGAGIGRQARSRNIAVAARRSVSPPPAKAPVVSTIRQPLKDGNVSTRRDVTTTGNVVPKPSVKESGRQASKENSAPSRVPKNVTVTSTVRSKLGPSSQTVGRGSKTIAVPRNAKNVRCENAEDPVVASLDNKTSTLGDIDPCMIPLPEEVDDDGDLSDVVQVKAEPLVVAVPEDLVQNDIFSVVTPVLVKVDDAIVADSVASLSSPAHVGVTNNAKCADIGIEQATMPDIDIEGSQQASEEHSEEVIAKNALTPTKTSSSAALAIAESIISIHGLHEEQVGASIEVEESAGLPANAVQAVHEIGQNYWKSIFDASDDDLSSSVGAIPTDPSMDENQLAKIREEFALPIPEPPIMKFADWVDPVLAMTAVGVVPKDLGEYTGPNVSPDGPIQPKGVFLPHPKAAALARQESETPGWRTKFYDAFAFKTRTASASNLSSMPSSPKTVPRQASPPADTPPLSEGSASPPESPTPASTRSVTPESITAQAAPQAPVAASTPFSSKLRSLSRIFGRGASSA
ncbi:hypothetical protein FOMPIDRAFT_1016059 [Fomitopsis schrenkii]|uniref:Uncharacterized protein n=1 Tax=Fomitopsis schrenkii TaxID=2126942 RepID=S8FS47_FOMSC|nr:hypothetical protein FOMPIDRAFT_1016059 [Fomitopsis schrenkii]